MDHYQGIKDRNPVSASNTVQVSSVRAIHSCTSPSVFAGKKYTKPSSNVDGANGVDANTGAVSKIVEYKSNLFHWLTNKEPDP
jgi:hypothetical protein